MDFCNARTRLVNRPRFQSNDMRIPIFLLFFLLSASLGARTPNFIVIFCDDLGYGDLGVFGNPTIETPNLDRMAQEGQKWTQFYSADPICTPSRAGLLTGRYPIRNGMTSAARGVLFPDSSGGLPQGEVTIAEVLKQKDYATTAIGKWHLGHLPQHLPMTQGFDSYWGIPYSNDMDGVKGRPNYRQNADDPNYYPDIKHYNVPLMDGAKIIERPADQNTITKRYNERAVDYIKQNKDRPFFLYLAHSMVHIPLFVSEQFLGKSVRGLYGDTVEEIDWGVGMILETLRDEGLEKDTVVVFSSDNGPWLAFKTHGGSSGPLRAGKGTNFEGGQRVPTIFWGPGYVKPGIVNGMGSTIDLLETFASLAGANSPADRKMDGYDLSQTLAGEAESPRSEFHYWNRAKLHAVRSGPWKLHLIQREPVNYSRIASMDGPELYNLEYDISEAYDVAATHPKIVKRLLNMIKEHENDTADSLPDQLGARIK